MSTCKPDCSCRGTCDAEEGRSCTTRTFAPAEVAPLFRVPPLDVAASTRTLARLAMDEADLSRRITAVRRWRGE